VFLLALWLRYLSTQVSQDRTVQFWVFFVGQALLGLVTPFIGLNVITTVTSLWFGTSERAIAATVAIVANIVAPALAFGIAPAVVVTGSYISIYLLGEAAFGSAAAFGILFIFVEKPPTPPSSTAETSDGHKANKTDEEKSFWGTLKQYGRDMKTIITSFWFVVLLTGYAFGSGAVGALVALINQVSTPEGYSGTEAGLFGVAIVASSIFGALAAGFFLDRTRRYILVLRSFGTVYVILPMSWRCLDAQFLSLQRCWSVYRAYIPLATQSIRCRHCMLRRTRHFCSRTGSSML
jgi:MFS transporter, FLVCR family, MFS-domain-containing protein 7